MEKTNQDLCEPKASAKIKGRAMRNFEKYQSREKGHRQGLAPQKYTRHKEPRLQKGGRSIREGRQNTTQDASCRVGGKGIS